MFGIRIFPSHNDSELVENDFQDLNSLNKEPITSFLFEYLHVKFIIVTLNRFFRFFESVLVMNDDDDVYNDINSNCITQSFTSDTTVYIHIDRHLSDLNIFQCRPSLSFRITIYHT